MTKRGATLPKDMLKSVSPTRIFCASVQLQKDVYCIIPIMLEGLHSCSGMQMKAPFPTIISSTCHMGLRREDSGPSNTWYLALSPMVYSRLTQLTAHLARL